MAKTGLKHLQSLRDGREVYLNGKKISDVTTHPAFKNAVAASAKLYDFQSDQNTLVLALKNVIRHIFCPTHVALQSGNDDEAGRTSFTRLCILPFLKNMV